MHTAIEISSRTKIIAGVGLLVAVAAAAGVWFFLFEEDPPPQGRNGTC